MTLAALFSLLAAAGLVFSVSGQRVLAVGVTKTPGAPHHHKRAGGPYPMDIENAHSHGGYLAHVKMGTPPQPVALFVDTGSSDTWVFGADPGACPSGACVSAFDAGASSSYRALPGEKGQFHITYGDGSSVGGDWFTDRLEVAEAAAVSSLQMGVATRSSPELRHGVMGLGFAANEAGSARRYPNLMDQLHNQGIIGTKAFSLYLNDFHAASGRLLLGGLDRARYAGELIAMPLAATQDGEYRHFAVALAGMAMRFPDGATTAVLGDDGPGVPAVLDAGATLSHLPPGAVDAVVRALNAVPTNDGIILVGCGLLAAAAAAAAPTFEFRFGGPDGPTVRVPVSELVLDVLRPRIEDGSVRVPADWPLAADATCLLGLTPAAEGSPVVVGQTILRSAYVVYDLANRQVAMAQAKWNVTTSDVVEWGTRASGIPATSAVTQVVTITPAATGTTGSPGDGDDDDDWLPPTVTVTSTDGAAEATGTRAGNAAAPTIQAFPCKVLVMIALTAVCVVLGGLVEWV